jgi:hypothetical protein
MLSLYQNSPSDEERERERRGRGRDRETRTPKTGHCRAAHNMKALMCLTRSTNSIRHSKSYNHRLSLYAHTWSTDATTWSCSTLAGLPILCQEWWWWWLMTYTFWPGFDPEVRCVHRPNTGWVVSACQTLLWHEGVSIVLRLWCGLQKSALVVTIHIYFRDLTGRVPSMYRNRTWTGNLT